MGTGRLSSCLPKTSSIQGEVKSLNPPQPLITPRHKTLKRDDKFAVHRFIDEFARPPTHYTDSTSWNVTSQALLVHRHCSPGCCYCWCSVGGPAVHRGIGPARLTSAPRSVRRFRLVRSAVLSPGFWLWFCFGFESRSRPGRWL